MTFLFVGGKKNGWNSLAMPSERKKTVELFKPLHRNREKELLNLNYTVFNGIHYQSGSVSGIGFRKDILAVLVYGSFTEE